MPANVPRGARWLAPALLAGCAGAGNAAAAPSEAPEVRAVWYNFYKLPPLRASAEPAVDRHVASLKAMGINRIYALVKNPDGGVCYESKKYAKWSSLVADPAAPGRKRRATLDWDPFGHLVKRGAENGIEIFPYVNVFCEGGEDAEDRKRNGLLGPHPEWAVTNRKGERVGWASPAVPEVVEYELGILKEVMRLYDVPGIQLDRIRLPSGVEGGNGQVDYHPEAVRRFKAKAGRKDAGLPDDNDPEWVRFRQDLITDFVKAARREVKAVRPRARLSVAVFPNAESAARRQFQDWALWAREGHVDELVTMAYEKDPEKWGKIIAGEAAAAGGKVPLYVGVGALNFTSPDQIAPHLAIARRLPAQGYCFFNAYSLFEKPGLPEAVADANR